MASTWTKRVRRAGTLLLLFAVAVLLAACSGDFNIRQAMPPDAATTQGQAISDVYTIVFVIGVAIFILVEGLILFAVLRYRRRRSQVDLPPQIHGNMTLEVVWTAIPIAIVLFLFFFSWQTLNTISTRAADPADPPVRIGVVAFQWQWEFVYAPPDVRWEDCGTPENKGRCVTIFGTPPANNDRSKWTPPQLHVPLGKTVELQLHSLDVIHSFYVPAFLFQRDITPHLDQVVQFSADRLGTFRGQCTQFCGLLHQQMEFQVVVQAPADYNAWLQEALTPPPSPSPGPSAAPGSPGPGSPAPSGAPAEPTTVPGAETPPPGGTTLRLSAQGIAYDTEALSAPAGAPFAIEFTNDDAGIPHNVEIRDASGTAVFSDTPFPGIETRTYTVPALPAGDYKFVCTVHPNMVGTLTVK